MYGLFHAEVDALAAFDLRQPKFRVHALARNDLGEALQPIVRGGATAFANVSGVVIQQADVAIAGIRVALARADATVEELRDALERQRAAARARIDTVQVRASATAAEVAAARGRRDRARQLWEDTPLRQIALKADRRNAWLRAVAQYTAVAARYAAQLATVAAAQRILDAMPPVDQSIAVMAATAAARAVRTQMETAERRLEQLRQQHDALVAAIAQGGTLFAITLAEVTADLEMLRAGRALEWRLTGVFVNQPFDITSTVDFTEPAAAGGALLSRLIQR
jgi:hypothetical protein